MTDRVWISWEIHRRSRTTSAILGASLFEFGYKLSRWAKYPLAIAKTSRVFFREKPKIIFAQNPSIVLAIFAVCYGRIFGIPVVIDAHNAGIQPFGNRKRWANILANIIMRLATLTIVTNNRLREYVIAHGGCPFVLPDPLPPLKRPNKYLSLKGKHNILFICAWAEDEPYLEVLKAALQLDDSIYIYITGNSKAKERALNMAIASNVILTGYLEEAVYLQFLFSADIVMDLTTRDDCLVCGAYEAVAAEKPLILSGTAALKSYFYKGVVYTDNSADDIAQKIRVALEKRDQLINSVRELKAELLSQALSKHQELEKILAHLVL